MRPGPGSEQDEQMDQGPREGELSGNNVDGVEEAWEDGEKEGKMQGGRSTMTTVPRAAPVVGADYRAKSNTSRREGGAISEPQTTCLPSRRLGDGSSRRIRQYWREDEATMPRLRLSTLQASRETCSVDILYTSSSFRGRGNGGGSGDQHQGGRAEVSSSEYRISHSISSASRHFFSSPAVPLRV